MQSKDTLKRHAHLVDKMADALGLDLEEKAMEGKLSFGELSDAVLRCTSCSDPDGCEHWLSGLDGPVEKTPAMCRNAQMFDMLKSGKRV